jgi:hypothetical protein
MNQTRRLILILLMSVGAALLAFPLRETIYETVVIPVAFIGFQVGLFYHSFSQAIWWWLIIAVVLFMLAFSLIPELKPIRRGQEKSKPRHGQVEELAIWLGRARSGVYFKWLVANRLGKLAHQILLDRESGRPRSVFAPLLGQDWQPSKELQTYLETGLHGSFSDFPLPRRPLATPPKTPLDHNVGEAVEFLESQFENGHSSQRHKGEEKTF